MRFTRSLALLALTSACLSAALAEEAAAETRDLDLDTTSPPPSAPSTDFTSSATSVEPVDGRQVDIVNFVHRNARYSLSVEPRAADPASEATHCGDTDVVFHTVNGPVSLSVATAPHADLELFDDDDGVAVDGPATRWVHVELESTCVWQAPATPDHPAQPLELISARVTERGVRAAAGVSDFTIHWDRTARSVAAIVAQPTLRRGEELPSVVAAAAAAGDDTPSTLFTSSPSAVGDGEGGEPATGSSVDERLEQLIRLIEADEAKLEALVLRIAANQKTIEEIVWPADENDSSDDPAPTCSGLRCLLRSILSKSKDCIHRIYLKVTNLVSSPSSPADGRDPCSYMASASPAARVKVLMDPTNACYGDEKKRPDTKEYALLSEHHDEFDDDELSSSSSSPDGHAEADPSYLRSGPGATYGEGSGERRRGPLYAALGVLAAVLCFGCCGTAVYSSCCNPRARADRAAWLEERRVQREYRQLARRHALRDWWARRGISFGACSCCGGRRKGGGTADYEEKRVLILRQQQRLEDAAQEEIQYLVRSHRLNQNPASAAEEGRSTVPLPRHLRSRDRRQSQSAGTTGDAAATTQRRNRASTVGSVGSNGESLPSYRSRSTGPPSYRARSSSRRRRARGTAAADFDPSSYVSDGFRDYSPNTVTPSAAGTAYSASTPPLSYSSSTNTTLSSPAPSPPRSRAPSVRGSPDTPSDLTPDSSVIALSPRGSSETLRTELSMVS